MADWTFEGVLMGIQSLPSIPASVLQSADGLHLGDICFAKIHTTLQMCTVPIPILEKWVENGSFNPECMAESDYSHSRAILIVLNPNAKGMNIESMSIRLIVHRHKAPLGQINTIPHIINYAHFLMEAERQSTEPECRTFYMIMGNYGGHMAFFHRSSVLHSLCLGFSSQRGSCPDDL